MRRKLLARCYRSSLELASRHELTSVAFPAISCGVFGYPVEKAASVAFAAVSEYLLVDQALKHVVFVAFDRDVYEALKAAFTLE